MPRSLPITFPRGLVNQILQCAQQQPGLEVCGLIGARNGIPRTLYAVTNVAESPDFRFALDPQQQIAAIRAMRDHGEELFAVFHSHPAAPAEPSTWDLEEAGYPELLHLIVSLGTPGVLELRGFRFSRSGGFDEVPLLLEAGN